MIRTLSSYSLLAAVLLSSVYGFTGSAHAAEQVEPQLAFHSSQGWKLDQNNQSCTLQTTFNNGFIARFNGGSTGMETLNIDFVQKAFETNKAYDITLGVPGKESLKTKSTALNANALDISLRNRKDFFQSLSQASVMDLYIDKNSFRFYLTGFAKPAQDFQECVNKTALADKQKLKTTQDPTHNEAQELEAQIIQKPEQKAAQAPIPLKEEKISTKNTKSAPEKIIETPKQEAAMNKPGFVPKNAALTPEALASMAAQQTSAPAPVTEKAKIETPQPSPIAQDAQEPEVIAKEHDDIEPAAAILPEIENFSSPEMKVTKSSFKAEADFTDQGLNAPPANLTSSDMARLAELKNLVEKLKAENIALNNELKTTVRASEEERLSISSENWNLEQATMRFNEAERQIKRLGQELQQERAQCAAEKKDLEASLFDPQITGQEQLARLAALEEELAQMKEENARLKKGQAKTP